MDDHNRTRKHVLDLPLEVKADGEPGAFEGYGTIFGNLDRDGDIVAKGAFADSLKAGMPALLWQHGWGGHQGRDANHTLFKFPTRQKHGTSLSLLRLQL